MSRQHGKETNIRLLALVTTLAGCMSESKTLDGAEATDPSTTPSATTTEVPSSIRIDVLPSQLLDEDGEFRVLPRSIGPVEVDADYDAGVVALAAPVRLDGEVFGEYVTPVASGATLPIVIDAVPATVSILHDASVQNYVAATDELGGFSALVVPDDAYDLVVVPDDPAVPFRVFSVRVGESAPFQELFLEYGVAIWGRVTDANGAPLGEVEVWAEDTLGARGAAALTDADGEYLLRVAPNATYDIVAAGRVDMNGRDPVLTERDVTVEELGVPVDFVYADLEPIFRSGRIEATDGTPLDDVTVRFRSKSLDGYGEADAQLDVETQTSGGNFDARLLAGTYSVEIRPPVSDDPSLDHSPLATTEVVVEGSPEDIGTLVLSSLAEVSGLVLTAEGEIVEDANVRCRENGFGAREWATYTDAGGAWALQLPRVPLSCTTTPPGALRLDYASSRVQVDPVATPYLELRLVAGVAVTGQVEFQGQPEPYTVVEVRDAMGDLMGSTLTEDNGRFDLRVALP